MQNSAGGAVGATKLLTNLGYQKLLGLNKTWQDFTILSPMKMPFEFSQSIRTAANAKTASTIACF